MSQDTAEVAALLEKATVVNPKKLFQYVVCPEFVLQDRRLTPTQKLVVARILGYAEYDSYDCVVRGRAQVRVATIAKQIDRSEREVQRIVGQLERLGILQIQRFMNRSSVYHPIVPEDAKRGAENKLFIPKWLMPIPEIAPRTKLTYCAISQAVSVSGAFASYTDLASRIGASRSSVVKDVGVLRDGGWIEVHRGSGHSVNLYFVLPQPEMFEGFRKDAIVVVSEGVLQHDDL
jgi:predicted transcriptional regulator